MKMCSFSGNDSSSEIYETFDEAGERINCSFDVQENSDGLARNGIINYSPELSSIQSQIRWGFLIHTYGFGCLFFFLAFYAFFSILNLRSQLSTRPYMSTINSFLCLLGSSRAAALFIDPYSLKKVLPMLMALLWDLGFPCLISSFSLIQIAFLQLTQSMPTHKLSKMSPAENSSKVFIVSEWESDTSQLDNGSEKFRKKTCLSIIITIHFAVVIASAIYCSFSNNLMLVKLIIQLAFTLWGFILCGTFLFASRRVLGEIGEGKEKGSKKPPKMNPKGAMALLGAGPGGQNLASSLTAALAPTLLRASTPKIKITDENDRTVSVASDSSRIIDTIDQTTSAEVRPTIIVNSPKPGPSNSAKTFSNSTTTTTATSSVHHHKGSNKTTVNTTTTTSDTDSSTTSCRPPSPVLPIRKKSGGSSKELQQGGQPATVTITTTPTNSSSSKRIRLNRHSLPQDNNSNSNSTNINGQNKGGKDGDKEKNSSSGGGSGKKKTLSFSLENEVIPVPSSSTGGSSGKQRKRGKSLQNDGKSTSDKISNVLSTSESGGESSSTTSAGKRRSSRNKSINGSQNQMQIQDAENERLAAAAEASGGGETLLMTGNSGVPDLTLQSILSHIAYVNQTALDYRLSRKLSRKNQVHKVIKYTSITALLGLLLCIGELLRILTYGIFASWLEVQPWPWFAVQTICRIIEFGMGAVVANITKQPVNRPGQHYAAYSFRHKHQRESLYL